MMVKFLSISAESKNFKSVLDFVFSQVRNISGALGRKPEYELKLVCEEVFMNIVSYAYPEATGMVTVGCEVDDEGRLLMETIDSGIPFNPLELEDPDFDDDLENRSIGGLGIFILKNTMDHISYERRNGQNVLHMEKHLPVKRIEASALPQEV